MADVFAGICKAAQNLQVCVLVLRQGEDALALAASGPTNVHGHNCKPNSFRVNVDGTAWLVRF